MFSSIQEIREDLFEEKDVRLFIKRDDLLDPLGFGGEQIYAGNKWRKLKANLNVYLSQARKPILSFGGAFSNHLYALATIANHYRLETIAVVRGESESQSNPTLSHCRKMGMQLHFVNRTDYRRRKEESYIQELKKQFGDCHVLPEGGSNENAVLSCAEIVTESNSQLNFDVICSAVGTGATFAGIVSALKGEKIAMGFPALKGDFLKSDVQGFLGKETIYRNWDLQKNFHFGGYARFNEELLDFIAAFYKRHQIRLDPIYTAKMMFGIYALAKNGSFKTGTQILAIHTGGLQGVEGFQQRHKLQLYH